MTFQVNHRRQLNGNSDLFFHMNFIKDNDEKWMRQALLLAQNAQTQNEVPVGAVIVHENCVIAEGWNQPIAQHDPTAHAEIVALRQAAKALKNYRLTDATLYVTLEPCAMCIGAMIHARVKRLVFGALDPRAGALASVFKIADEARLNHRIAWEGGVLAQPCSDILKAFFKARR